MTFDLTLDRLHEMLAEIPIDLEELVHLHDAGVEQVGPYQLPFLSEACQDMFGYWSMYGRELPSAMKMPRKLINSFIKDFDDVPVRDAKMLAERTITYLKSIEGEVAAKELGTLVEEVEPVQNSSTEDRSDVLLKGLNSVNPQWLELTKTDEVGVIISEISGLLDRVIRSVKTSNLLSSDRALSELERAQIIAILETAIVMLKAPLVEKGLLKKAADDLAEVGKKTARKKTEVALGKLADMAAKALLKLLMTMNS